MFEKRVQLYEFAPDPANKNTSLSKFIDRIGRHKRVLEVGCASGYVSAYLTQRLDCEVVGIDLNPEAAKKAKASCREVIVGDIEKDALEKVTGVFDVITFGDVLEHLVCPSVVLSRARDYLAEGGYVLVSIPNVAHYTIRKNLLLGRFDYQQYGIMDQTHLRFFTFRTARQLLQDAGYVIDDFDVVYDAPAMRFFPPSGLLARFLRKCFPELFSVQFIFKASRHADGNDGNTCGESRS